MARLHDVISHNKRITSLTMLIQTTRFCNPEVETQKLKNSTMNYDWQQEVRSGESEVLWPSEWSCIYVRSRVAGSSGVAHV